MSITAEFRLLPWNKAAGGENSFLVALIRQQEKTVWLKITT